jgi:DNA polymerase II large subunit
LDEALRISLEFQVPLHPQFLYYWDQISPLELSLILHPKKVEENSIEYSLEVKKILEKLGVPHKQKDSIFLEENEAKIFYNLLFKKLPIINDLSVPKTISKYSKIPIKNKFSTSIGVRIGRPEKAAARQMKPPTHVLFPVSDKGGPTRDLLKASRHANFFTNIFNRQCTNCNEPSIGINCSKCGKKTSIIFNVSIAEKFLIPLIVKNVNEKLPLTPTNHFH